MEKELQKPMMDFVETTMSLIQQLNDDMTENKGQISSHTLDVLELLIHRLEALSDTLDVLNGVQ